MLKIELNKRNIAIISSIIIFLFILILFLYLPVSREVKKKTLEWNSLKSRLTADQDNLKVIKEARVDKKLIQEQDISFVVDVITKEGRRLPLNFKSITQGKLKHDENNQPVLPVQMDIEGGYEQLGRFFGVLENIKDSVITVENFSLKCNDRFSPNIYTSLLINIYLAQD